MEVNIYLSVLVCILGLVIFLVSDSKPDIKHVGEVMFSWGLLVTLICFCHGIFIGSVK